ncbi:MAG: hypothetical protein V2I43_00815 [Parvularcula sp.]|nr:hypothetical protein [Parvularcula sp.]
MTVAKEKKKKSCFVICPIGADKSASRERSDKVLKYIIKPVMEESQYVVERADQIDEPGIITNQIVKKIVESDILIADLTEGNPNVFYELAIRHGLKRPFIHMIDASEKIPFDNSQVRTIQFDIRDLDSVDSAKKQLQAQVSAIDGGDFVTESPISVAFDLEALKAGGGDSSNLLATMLDEVMTLSREVRSIKRQSPVRRVFQQIDEKSELVRLLHEFKQIPLLNRVERHVDMIYSGGPGSFSISTDLPDDEERQLVNELSELLLIATGRRWKIDAMPF